VRAFECEVGVSEAFDPDSGLQHPPVLRYRGIWDTGASGSVITAKVGAGGWRIWETGISYTSRNYAEGKKITWKDGIAVFVCIVRYGISVRVRPLIQSARTSRIS